MATWLNDGYTFHYKDINAKRKYFICLLAAVGICVFYIFVWLHPMLVGSSFPESESESPSVMSDSL